MPLYFITGSAGKFSEAQRTIPQLQQLDIDLPEIQSLDVQEILTAKVQAAYDHHQGEFLVEDTGLYFEGLPGLPGPFIKWFFKSLDNPGLFHLSQSLGNNAALVKITVAYAQSREVIHFFEGSVKGTIVSPRGTEGFGWDPIFMPDGETHTFAELGEHGKQQYNPRRIAFEQLARFLDNPQ
jgi:non-canonical purine NTP pyrophosphatase (RdgB/HAM1 family)